MNPFAELVSMVIGIYANIVVLRFFLQYFRADFYNPLSQFVVKATDPIVKPMRKLIPGFAGLDISSLVAAWLVYLLSMLLVALLSASIGTIKLTQFLVFPIFELIDGCFNLFMFLIFIRAISSWFAGGGYNPVLQVVAQVTEPILKPCRKLLPVAGGLDLSPLIALLGLMFVSRFLQYYIYPLIAGLLI